MNARIGKWGNSPALRLPKTLLGLAGFSANQQVKITATDGKILIEPAEPTEFNLDDLISQIREANMHGLVDFGSPVGKELL